MKLDCALFAFLLGVTQAALPNLPDYQKLEDHVLDHADPKAIFGTSSEIGDKARPVRVGSLRSGAPIPSHHFASNMLKSMDRMDPMRLFPYEAMMDKTGTVWDAYTMERWYDPVRTDLMEQQSAWEQGKSWVKLNDMGTNLKQMVSGPDGNPLGIFEAESGARVGFDGSQEPVLKEFGDLYANFFFSGSGRFMMSQLLSTNKLPVVRGATLSTHIFKNVNPVVKPHFLSKIGGQNVHFDCPMERSGTIKIE